MNRVKTINFEKIVLKKLEERAKKEGTSVSKLVNFFCRDKVLTDAHYFEEMARNHYLKFQEFKYLKEQSVIIKEIRSVK